MKTLISLLLCSSLAFGQAADAPLADPPIPNLPPPGKVLELQAGDVLPWDATVLDKQQALRASKLLAFYKGEGQSLKEGNTILPTYQFILIVTGVAVAAAAAAAGVTVWAANELKKP